MSPLLLGEKRMTQSEIMEEIHWMFKEIVTELRLMKRKPKR